MKDKRKKGHGQVREDEESDECDDEEVMIYLALIMRILEKSRE